MSHVNIILSKQPKVQFTITILHTFMAMIIPPQLMLQLHTHKLFRQRLTYLS